MIEPVLPGATLGMLGSGQLGRMFALAARQMGYRVHVLSPKIDTPTGQVADREVVADYDDLDAVREFASHVDVVSYEFENVPLATLQAIEDCGVPGRPSGRVLETAQNRIREKTFLRDAGFPVAPFQVIASEEDARQADAQLVPGVLKTASFGYDGKGQAKIQTLEELPTVWTGSFLQDCVLEQLVDFELELSVVAARGVGGEIYCYGPMENLHSRHILDISLCPARIPKPVADRAIELATAVMDQLQVVGVLCVEMFLDRSHQLLINELAPRPHNSGHLTIEAHRTSQFEQQVRAICHLPLGSAEQLRPAAMANLLGDLWRQKDPDWLAACQDPAVKLHLYGKHTAKPGRKMGHLTALGATVEEARLAVEAARQRL